jgi:hypothetical protein
MTEAFYQGGDRKEPGLRGGGVCVGRGGGGEGGRGLFSSKGKKFLKSFKLLQTPCLCLVTEVSFEGGDRRGPGVGWGIGGRGRT